jgi:hypothetical protein
MNSRNYREVHIDSASSKNVSSLVGKKSTLPSTFPEKRAVTIFRELAKERIIQLLAIFCLLFSLLCFHEMTEQYCTYAPSIRLPGWQSMSTP